MLFHSKNISIFINTLNIHSNFHSFYILTIDILYMMEKEKNSRNLWRMLNLPKYPKPKNTVSFHRKVNIDWHHITNKMQKHLNINYNHLFNDYKNIHFYIKYIVPHYCIFDILQYLYIQNMCYCWDRNSTHILCKLGGFRSLCRYDSFTKGSDISGPLGSCSNNILKWANKLLQQFLYYYLKNIRGNVFLMNIIYKI